MPARRPSKTAFDSATMIVAADGHIGQEERPRKRSKQSDDERICIDIRAAFPNWVPATPPSPSSSSSPQSPPFSHSAPEHHPVQANPAQAISQLRAESLTESQTKTTTSSEKPKARRKPSVKGTGKGAGGPRQTAPIAAPAALVPRFRNAGHNIPEIFVGPYAAYLDRHGQRAEYLPHALLRRLEKDRQDRAAYALGLYTEPTALTNSSSSLPQDPAIITPSDSGTSSFASIKSVSNRRLEQSVSPSAVWVVAHTQRGGYDWRGTDPSAGTGIRLHGVFGSLEGANVQAMEMFRKLHRDFLLSSSTTPSFGLSLGYGTDGLVFPFVEQTPAEQRSSPHQQDHRHAGIGSGAASPGTFAERHPSQFEPLAPGDGHSADSGVGGDDDEGASWWVDAAGCLSFRAANWGIGDSRIFVVRQEFSS
ncbi:hypothetical protein F5Y16DRAFT_401864 [Xylariaceae sp. FL0255]|nr:hypothetical protein F5Y16DRAFT_401864 [Xylariaceae sp. FL0255]